MAGREIDLIMEKQNKRARGHGQMDKECRTPPYPRAARVARATRAMPSSQGKEFWGDDEPIATHQGIQPTQPIPIYIGAYHPQLSSMMPHQFESRMMLNLHIDIVMPSLPSLPREAWGDLVPKTIVRIRNEIINKR